MTTTSKAAKSNQPNTANGANKPAPIGDGWDDAPRATSDGQECAEWHPEMSELKEEVIANKLAGKPAGSTATLVLVGTLSIQQAFGEPRYFLDVAPSENGGDPVRYALPLHGVLTAALDHYPMTDKNGMAPLVRLAFMGRAPRAKPGQQAAFLYDVRSKNAVLLPKVRETPPALFEIHRANKEARDAEAAEAKG